jgi:hypothetical protein
MENIQLAQLLKRNAININGFKEILKEDLRISYSLQYRKEKSKTDPTKTFRRLFINSENSNFAGIGWILDEDATECMICEESFGIFTYRHHCRACGNVVCNTCSKFKAKIATLEELGFVRVCSRCFVGKDVLINIRNKFLQVI